MPYKDDKLLWKIRISRNYRARLEKARKNTGKPIIRLVEEGVDKILTELENRTT